MKFLKFVLEILLVYFRIWTGWVRVLLRALQILFSEFLILSKWKQIFLILGFLQIVFTIRPWISYSVQFLNEREILQISIKSNLWILLLLMLNFFGNLFFFTKFFYFHLSFQLMASFIVVVGIFYPNLLFTNFLKIEDYTYNLNFYTFLFFHFSATFLHMLYIFTYRRAKHEISSTT